MINRMIIALTPEMKFLLVFAMLILPPFIYHNFRAIKFKRYAQEKGFSFAVEKILSDDVGQFYITGSRSVSQRQYRNVIYGKISGANFFIFEYRYRLRTKPTRWVPVSRPQTIILFVDTSINFPHFTLLPKHTFIWDHPIFGDKFLKIKDDNQFRSLYLLQGENEDAVRNLFDDSVRAHFVKLINKSCEGKGEQFLYYYDGHWYDPSRIDSLLEEAFEAFELFRKKIRADATG